MRWPKMSPLTAEQRQLAEDNYPLVLFTMRRLWLDPIVGQLQDDALGEGYLALVKAARAFDPKRGVKFSTYAIRVIKHEVYWAARRWKKKTFVPDSQLLPSRYEVDVSGDKRL